ncbi:MAG: hypothetical protein ACREAC_14725, partial [Blastocatellia bacterium]
MFISFLLSLQSSYRRDAKYLRDAVWTGVPWKQLSIVETVQAARFLQSAKARGTSRSGAERQVAPTGKS